MVEFQYCPPMMESATPYYDPENPSWSEIVGRAHQSAHGAIGGTLVPLAVKSIGTLSPTTAWAQFSLDQPVQAGVILADYKANSSDPLQAVYQLSKRCVIGGYSAIRHGTLQPLCIQVTCPNCSAIFTPWGQISGPTPPE